MTYSSVSQHIFTTMDHLESFFFVKPRLEKWCKLYMTHISLDPWTTDDKSMDHWLGNTELAKR